MPTVVFNGGFHVVRRQRKVVQLENNICPGKIRHVIELVMEADLSCN